MTRAAVAAMGRMILPHSRDVVLAAVRTAPATGFPVEIHMDPATVAPSTVHMTSVVVWHSARYHDWHWRLLDLGEVALHLVDMLCLCALPKCFLWLLHHVVRQRRSSGH